MKKNLDWQSIAESLIAVACGCIIALLFVLIIIKVSPKSQPETIIVRGHEYIEFSNGVVHDPQCAKCADAVKNAMLNSALSY